MKQLKLTNPKYRQLEAGYGEWLSVLGYAGSSVVLLAAERSGVFVLARTAGPNATLKQ